MDPFLRALAEPIASRLGVNPDEVARAFGTPPDAAMGDVSLPCFPFADSLRRPPAAIAGELAAARIKLPWVRHVEAVGPYLNLHLEPASFAGAVIGEVMRRGAAYGTSDEGSGATVVVDYSSPNIAKHLAVHHLRSTMIGNAIVRLHRALGYRVVGINHLGDWGTACGKLLAGWELLADELELEERPLRERADPTAELNRLYTRFHEELEREPELEARARSWFQRLEERDPVARGRWEEIRALSLERLQRVYDRLGVRFEEVIGESFFEGRMAPVIAELERLGLLEESDAAQVVRLDDLGTPPMLIRKQDGATLYGTRDLAAAEYRWQRWRFARCLYVVDAGQKLHFRQLFEVLRRMGREYAARMEHIDFGVLRLNIEGSWVKGRTRHGKVVLLEEVLDRAVARAREIIVEKNPSIENLDEVAEAVGTGAVIFADLKAGRAKDVNFDLDQVVNFEGQTGPYLQYTHARTSGILRRYHGPLDPPADGSRLVTPEEFALIKEIARYPGQVSRAAREAEPSVVSQQLLQLAGLFNKFYERHKVLHEDPDLAHQRITLVRALRQVLAAGLAVIGLRPLDRM